MNNEDDIFDIIDKSESDAKAEDVSYDIEDGKDIDDTADLFEDKSLFETDGEDVSEKSPTDMKRDAKNAIRDEVISWIKMIVIAFLIAVFIDKFIIVNATVPTASMENTIVTGSRMIGLRFAYWFGEPDRGDIVVFKYPLDDDSGNYIKRIIGLPGEKVEIKEGKIYIYEPDAEEAFVLEEPYLKEEWITRNDGYVFEIPENSYLMMGDNRNNSADARVWMEKVEAHNYYYPDDQWDMDIIYVKSDKILGKAVVTYWPLDNIKVLK